MITRVSLVNWRSHMNSELEFSEGTNCLIGRMGSGKSSVLDAICFGLFGIFPQLQQKKVRLEDMIMKKPKQQRFAEITVSFGSNGDECTVKRRVEKGRSTNAEFRRNGKLVEMQPQKVTEEVEKILKADYDLFTRAVYSEQNQLDMFLTIPKGQRMKKIDELLRLDRFEAARVSAVSLENRFSFSREQREKMLEGMNEEGIKKESEALRAEIRGLEDEGRKLSAEAESIRLDRESTRRKIAWLEKTREELITLSEKLSSLEKLGMQLSSDISSLEKHLAAVCGNSAEELMRSIEALKERMKLASSGARKIRDFLLEKRLGIASEKNRLAQLVKAKEEKNRLEAVLGGGRLQKAMAELKAASEEFEKDAVALGSLKSGIASCELALKGLSSADSRCVVCGHELSEEKKKQLSAESLERLGALKAEASGTETLMGRHGTEKRNLEGLVSELCMAKTRMKGMENPEADIENAKLCVEALSRAEAEAEGRLKELDKNAASLQKEFESLVRECEAAKSAALKQAELGEKRRALEANAAEAKSARMGIFRIRESFSEELMKESLARMENIIGMEKSVEARLKAIAEIETEKRKRLEDAEARIRTAEYCRLDIRKAEAIEQQLQLLGRGLEATQERLRKDFISAINHAMHMIWESLYPYTDFSSVRMAVDGDYVLQLQDAEGWVSVDNVSGGERSIACLALRIAFALVLAPQLRWLVLDEPTHNLDGKAVAELANVLHDNISEFAEQVFLITHDTSLEQAVSGCLYRMEREKDGFTKAVRVEE